MIDEWVVKNILNYAGKSASPLRKASFAVSWEAQNMAIGRCACDFDRFNGDVFKDE